MLIRFVFSLLASQSVRAQNSMLGTAFEQMRAGAHCSQLNRDDAFQTKPRCQLSPPRTPEPVDVAAALENITFSAAATDQIAKDRCIASQARALAESENQFATWRGLLEQTWLRRRKVELMLKFCLENFLNVEHPSPTTEVETLWADWVRQDRSTHQYPFDPTFAQNEGTLPANHALQESREKRMKPWKDVCLDHRALGSLRAADQLLPASLPIVSSKELFNAMDEHRQLVTQLVSGAGARDPDILNADLRRLDMFDFDTNAEFDQTLKERLKDLSREREESADQLEKAKTDPGFFALDDTQKQYIYDDGTLNQALTEHFAGKSPAHLSLAESCMAARWQASQVGAGLDFGVSVLGGGALGWAYKGLRAVVTGTRAVQAARRVSLAAKLGSVAMGLTNVPDLLNVVGTCQHQHTSLTEPNPESLPNRIGYKKLGLNFKTTDACRDPRVQRMLFNSVDRASCTGEAIGSTLPSLGLAL